MAEGKGKGAASSHQGRQSQETRHQNGLWNELAEVAEQVAASAGEATVRIGRGGGRGAGVVVATDTVVTSAHNLRGPQVTVTFSAGRVTRGEVKAADIEGDLAVIAVPTEDISPLGYGTPDVDAALGSPVWALSRTPAGARRVTFGTVSAADQSFRGPRGRLVSGGIEHTAPLARGSSGGPIVDAGGRLLGINTHRLGDGFYLAVPADERFRQRVDSLAAGEAPAHRYLGIAITPPHAARRLRALVGLPERDGVLVRAVEPESPAEKAGIKAGDFIVATSTGEINVPDDLFAALDSEEATQPLTLKLVRGTEELTVEVIFT